MDAYTIPEAAAKLEVHPREVREWIEEGRLTAFDSVAGRRIPREELERLAEPAPPEPVVARLPAPGRLEEALDGLRADLEELEGLRGARAPHARPGPGALHAPGAHAALPRAGPRRPRAGRAPAADRASASIRRPCRR